MTTTHTPGPWKVCHEIAQGAKGCPHRLSIEGIRPGEVVARMATHSNGANLEAMKANATLIAASPELLEALKKIVFAAGGCDQFVVFQRIAEAAIAKAEGC